MALMVPEPLNVVRLVQDTVDAGEAVELVVLHKFLYPANKVAGAVGCCT